MTWKGIVGQSFTPDEFREHILHNVALTPAFLPEFIVVHNTQIPTLAGWRGKRSINALVDYYRDDMKWSGGPHLFISDQAIWAFTPLALPGVHSPSWNSRSWGVEIVGDFDREPFGTAQRELVLAALATLHRKRGWLEPHIRLHKEDPATTHTGCPGKNIVKADLEAGIAALLK